MILERYFFIIFDMMYSLSICDVRASEFDQIQSQFMFAHHLASIS